MLNLNCKVDRYDLDYSEPFGHIKIIDFEFHLVLTWLPKQNPDYI